MKKTLITAYLRKICCSKILKIMRNTLLILLINVFHIFATTTYSQIAKLSIDLHDVTVKEVLTQIEEQSEFYFLYNSKLIDVNRKTNINVKDQKIDLILSELFEKTDVNYLVFNRQIVLSPREYITSLKADLKQPISISGTVIDKNGEPMVGVTVMVKGTSQGTITDVTGKFSVSNLPEDAVLVFTYIGMQNQEVVVGNQTSFNIIMIDDIIGIEEVVAIGYGTRKKSDLTGSVIRANIETFRDQPNVSILQSLQGSVAGLNVGQINQAGGNPSVSIRGRTSISGVQNPLIILDGVIFRGNLIDVNPNDIESIDILKDNSAAAVYGSQAANGVIILTSKSGKTKHGKPVFNYSGYYTFQMPAFELKPGNGEEFIAKNTASDFLNSRTEESGYLESRNDYSPTSLFRVADHTKNYEAGKETNWYSLLTNDHIYNQNHNLSLTNKTENMDYFASLGFTDYKGYMINENYTRYNARININNKITNWFLVGIQSFASVSDNSGHSISPDRRYNMPYEAAYDDFGIPYQLTAQAEVNPIFAAQSDDKDIRNVFSGNIYTKIDFPFLKGLSYKINLNNNYQTSRHYYFRPYEQQFTGEGAKLYSNLYEISSDNIINYKRIIKDVHNLDITFVYGFEKRKNDFTNAIAFSFDNQVLSYNRLQSGSSVLQNTESGAWNETSIYNMGRLFYSYKNRYMLTGTIRRDGFSGFSEEYKFGLFPSLALAWVVTDNTYAPILNFINYLKLRVSYGSIGNRTIGRYQTLAKVGGNFGYVDASGNPLYTHEINSLASPNLKWETTTGVNLGADFAIRNSLISGSIEYYNNNTTNLLYNVDIPSIGRFNKFPDNLGGLHNHGLEITLNSENIKNNDFLWNSSFSFSRNRDKLKSLLGFDNDGDGKEDDLISEGLFIGQPLNVIYHYEITGDFYQFGDEVPAGAQVGSFIIVDQNNDGKIDQENDFKILGYTEPSYRIGVSNTIKYRSWALNLFIYSIQGGKDYYYGGDNLLFSQFGRGFNNLQGDQHWQYNFPKGLDYWLPENPNAKYQRVGMRIPGDLVASRFTQRNFIRLQDLSLSYTFNSKLTNKIEVNNLKLFVSGKNLITWTKWPGWDPETGEGITRDGRPVLRSYSVGINVEL